MPINIFITSLLQELAQYSPKLDSSHALSYLNLKAPKSFLPVCANFNPISYSSRLVPSFLSLKSSKYMFYIFWHFWHLSLYLMISCHDLQYLISWNTIIILFLLLVIMFLTRVNAMEPLNRGITVAIKDVNCSCKHPRRAIMKQWSMIRWTAHVITYI